LTAYVRALRLRLRGLRGSRPVVVEVTRHGAAATSEAFVQDVRRSGDRVEVAVLLADGSDATAQVDGVEWDWLDARRGDIVLVRRLECSAFSA
jgi:hypothetical protein